MPNSPDETLRRLTQAIERSRALRAVLVIAALGACQALFWKEILLRQNFTSWDKFDLLYPNLLYFADSLRSGILPFWNPLTGPGESLFHNVNTAYLFTPYSLLYLLFSSFLNPILAHEAVLQCVVLFGGMGAFFFLRRCRVAFLPALFSSALYGPLLSNLILGQPGFLSSVALFPWLFYWVVSLEDDAEGPRLPVLLFGALTLAIFLISGYPFLNMVFVGLAGIFFLSRAIHRYVTRREWPKKAALLRLSLFFGLLLLAYLAFVLPGMHAYQARYLPFTGDFIPPDRLIRPPFLPARDVVYLASFDEALKGIFALPGWGIGLGVLTLFALMLGARGALRGAHRGAYLFFMAAIVLIALYESGHLTRSTSLNRWIGIALFGAEASVLFMTAFSLDGFLRGGRRKVGKAVRWRTREPVRGGGARGGGRE
ncbi:MAG: hypothetical protein J0L75_05185 [Spirochaetes bacterium]|nr:hypothetical protein [Spirochaetota bacterium]